MKLHSVNGKLTMPHSHNQVSTPRGLFQAFWERIFTYDQRMIPGCFEGSIQPSKNTLSVVLDHGSFSMHQLLRTDDLPPIDLPDRLMPETYTQNGNL
jgi:hypothetical protein